jgi:hypothetical protein
LWVLDHRSGVTVHRKTGARRNERAAVRLTLPVRRHNGIPAAALACAALASAAAAGPAQASQASFAVSLTGSQTTRADASDRCRDAGGATATRSGQLTERVDFHTTRPGRLVFATVGRHGVVLKRQSAMLAGGTATRSSTLDERGITPSACAEVAPAADCGSRSFGDWRLSLAGSGAIALALRTGPVAGGDPFRTCQNPFDGFPRLARRAAARMTKRALFNRKKRTLKVGGRLDQRREFADGYTGAKGTVTTSLRFTAVLTRRR